MTAMELHWQTTLGKKKIGDPRGSPQSAQSRRPPPCGACLREASPPPEQPRSFPSMDASCRPTEASTDGFGDSDPPNLGLVRTEEEEYVESFVRVSLLLASEDLRKVQDHGSKMLKHLLKHRSEKISSTDLLKLKLQLVKLNTDSAVDSAEAISEETVPKIEKAKHKHNTSLLVLAARNNLRSQETGEADGVSASSTPGSSCQSISLDSGKRPLVSGDERVDLSLALDPSFHSGETVSPSMPLKNLGQLIWVSEDEIIDLTIDQTLQQIKSSCSFPQDAHLHSLPFPVDHPIPISSGTLPDYSDTPKRLVLSLESDGRSNGSNGFASTGNRNSCSPGEIDGSILSKSDGSSPEKSDGSNDSSGIMSDKKTQSSDWSVKAMGVDETISLNQGVGCLLLTEHNLLCEAFVIVTSCPGIQQYAIMLPCLLNSLNRIWTQREWNDKYVDTVSGLSNLFSDGQFLKMSYHIVKFCEEKLTGSVKNEYGACDVFPVALLQSIIPLFLRLLRCIHALWSVEIGIGWLPQEVDMAKSLSCNELGCLLEISDGLYTIDSDESFRENETRALLEGTRQRVYNFIGQCTTVEEAFSKLLDSLSVSNAFMEALECMEFRHLGKLIHLVAVPLVKHCPSELWEEWTVNFLEPILLQCEHRLHAAWFYHLYENQADSLFNYGNLVGEDEEIKSLGYMLLLEFTRKLSGLLEALALMEQTSVRLHEDVKPICNKDTVSSQDLNSVSPSSLFRFLLRHDCFGKLRMGLFGYFVDDEAARKALQFCRCLIRLAVSTNDGRLRLLIVDDLLPCLTRRLDNDLQCAVQDVMRPLRSSTTSSVDQELLVLCKDLYVNLVKDSDGKDKDSDSDENNFESWLTKEKGNLRVKACSAAKELPDGSDWNWEFEDEFQRYLPAYMEMLQQVDSIDACEVYDHLEEEALLQKLGTNFRSKYGINSREHPYMLTISSLWQRQCYSMSGILYQRKKIKCISELLKLKPHIKVFNCSSATISRLQEKIEINFEDPECAMLPSLDLLDDLLSLWEPVYHPLIRESHMDILLRKVDQYIKATEREHCQQVVPATLDFEVHLQPYADAFLRISLKRTCAAYNVFVSCRVGLCRIALTQGVTVPLLAHRAWIGM
ncbi:uncharacterized protein LOC124661368 [Lolium rigidum]|uniref:uncharacterized protein LOC124661368 n=1 Tax=Lolium rigidum TaxID=89674 RepID=UPI001F5CAFF5|nr:uncharacterized protein LOC124661368 [Lolium rigidum]